MGKRKMAEKIFLFKERESQNSESREPPLPRGGGEGGGERSRGRSKAEKRKVAETIFFVFTSRETLDLFVDIAVSKSSLYSLVDFSMLGLTLLILSSRQYRQNRIVVKQSRYS